MAIVLAQPPGAGRAGLHESTTMAWRPYENLIDGELDNRTQGKVTGWMRFFRQNEEPLHVVLDLAGDFLEDIRGKVIRLHNPHPSERAETFAPGATTYMDGFASMQNGNAGDITAGIALGRWTQEVADRLMTRNERKWAEANCFTRAERAALRREYAARYRKCVEAGDPYYAYVPHPYIEWYSEANGRVVLELDHSQVTIARGALRRKKTPHEAFMEGWKRHPEMIERLGGRVQPPPNRKEKEGDDARAPGAS